MRRRICILILLPAAMAAAISGQAQRGPGGVSHETPTQSDNRLWLTAGSLTGLSDGANVHTWTDVSHSEVQEVAQSDEDFLPPYFRDDPGASINGHPVVTFEEGRFFKIESSDDLNTEVTTTYEQTMVFAFRTSEDVTSRQVIWEEGGGVRGMNLYIYDGEIYLGVYDHYLDDDLGTGQVPEFGYSYVKSPIQPNTTYVISHLFWAPDDNSLGGWIRGYRNGHLFGTLLTNGDAAPGVGGVYRHPNPIGVGAVHSGSYMETGNIPGDETGKVAGTGQFHFRGRLAEVCYYNRLLNDAERVILENYLGAKYFAGNIANDIYDHQANYGHDVVGIGQTEIDADERHTVSQGLNPFEISADNETNFFSVPQKFILLGHNGSSMNLTEENTPNEPGSTLRTFRIWRFDKRGAGDDRVKFRFDADELPPLEPGYTKYVAIFDETSALFPNFSNANTKVLELTDDGNGGFEMAHNIADGTFMTLGMIKPRVSFVQAESFAVEGNPPPDSTLHFVQARLNYLPQNPVTVDVSIQDGTAIRSEHYGYQDSDFANGITIPANMQVVPIRIWVINNTISDPTETVKNAILNLEIGPNTTPGLGLGNQNQHSFWIYDDDPPPSASFLQGASNVLENVGTHEIQIVRTGSLDSPGHVSVQIEPSPQTTATPDVDFESFPTSKILVQFGENEASKTINLTIIDDDIDEYDETVQLRLVGPSSFNLAGEHPTHTVTIQDDDLPPVAGFIAAESQNFETFGNPGILIELDRPSAKDVTVYYTKTENLPTAATYDVDYTLAFPGAVNFPPGDTVATPITFLVMQDNEDEDDETVEFLLTGADNATLGGQLTHVYTIKDYSAFERHGAGGVGKDSDNIVWVEANRQSGSNNTPFSSLANFSPHNIGLHAPNSNNEALLRSVDIFLNGKKTFRFDGNNNAYEIDGSGLVNQAQFNSKSLFFALRTGGNVNQRQVIFKQGMGSRCLAVYIQEGDLYLHIINHLGVDSLRWGYDGTPGTERFAKFSGMQPNTDYVISGFFDKDNPKRIRLYVNGVEGDSETGDCGIFIQHQTASLGGVIGDVRFHDGTTGGYSSFAGNIAEFLYFSDAPVNESRRIIIENYLSIKYNIGLGANNIGTIGTDFHHRPAGIGAVNIAGNDLHLDSQGRSTLRIKSSNEITDGSFLFWADNDVPLTESWPWSNGNLPTGIIERSGKVWRVSKAGNINQVYLYIQYSELLQSGDFNLDDLKLLVHNNSDPQDFTGAGVFDATSLNSGPTVEFSNVVLQDGDYLALGSTSTTTPLPITLLDFGAKLKSGVVDITWKTASEKNSDYFSVQRSLDLEDWEEVVRTPAAAESNTVIHYREKDRSPLSGISYYRLEQLDFDGARTLSPVVSIFNPEFDGGDDIILYPNPVHGRSFVVLIPHHYGEKPVNIRIMDLLGRPHWEGRYEAPFHPEEISVPFLSPGTYLVHVHSPLINQSAKLIVR